MDDLLTSVRGILAVAPARWTGLAETLPASLFERRPAAGEWSASECLLHLIDTEHLLFGRLKALLAGEDFPAFHPETDGSQPGQASPLELAREYSRLRWVSLAALERLAPADLERTARHAELGPVTLSQMLHEWAGHDLNHLVQAERAFMQPFIEGCGPWRPYFADHDVAARK